MSDSPDSILFRLTELRSQMSGLEHRLGEQMEALTTRVTTEIVDLRVDLMARIDRLQDALTEQRQSDVVTVATADRAERIVKSSLQEDNLSLGEQISALTKMVRRLQTRVDRLEEGRGEGASQ